jgi:hypothetical protein
LPANAPYKGHQKEIDMTNHNGSKGKRGSTPALSTFTFWAWRGYSDRLAGLGFAAEYETLETSNQRNYERGRQVAATIIGVRGSAPAWRKTEKMSTVLKRSLSWSQQVDLSLTVTPLFFPRKAA